MKRLFLASAILLLAVAPSLAQSRQADARWHAWLGCWVPTGPEAISWDPTARQVCVVPSSGTSAVDIVTVTNGRIASREHIEASGEHRTSERDGCTGWESAEWSSDARRVYLQSEYQCVGGAKRSSSGLLAMSLKGEWLNIVGIGGAENTSVRVLHHRPAVVTAKMPNEITSALQPKTGAADAARAAALLPIGTGDIVEASHHVNAALVEAWLNEIGQTFTVDAKRLVELADRGVPVRVIDMLVALSYPAAFSIKPSPTSVGSLATGGRDTAGGGGDLDFLSGGDSVLDCGLYGNGFSLYGWDPCSPYGSALYGYSRYAYSPYNYALGGYGGYGGWYLGSEPTIVLSKPADSTGSTHGQVVNGRGYTESAGSSGVASAGSSDSSGSSFGGSSGAASAGGGERTAQPR